MQKWKTQTVTLLETQLDDVTGQEVGYLLQKFLEEGALDAICIPILMKKGRPGFLIQVLCLPKMADSFCELFFEETPTLGIRLQKLQRRILPRRKKVLKTSLGSVKAKEHFWKNQAVAIPEFDELVRLSRQKKRPLLKIRGQIA